MIQVAIHPSQFPDRVRADLIESLQRRQIKHKFHYESYKQAQKWLAVYETYSPALNDPTCVDVYERAFDAVAARFGNSSTNVIGLGCGSGHKDCLLLERLKAAGTTATYTAVDVSVPLVITARQRANPLSAGTHGVICDLEIADPAPVFAHTSRKSNLAQNRRDSRQTGAGRIFTFFGMLPNSEPAIILPRLRSFLRSGDLIVMNANLAPGSDYRSGVEAVLPQYANPETTDWLLTFLYDLGVPPTAGGLSFTIEEGASELLRIRADFRFAVECVIRLDDQAFDFSPGDSIGVFYSYRYTPERLQTILGSYDMKIDEWWVMPSDEEAVLLVKP